MDNQKRNWTFAKIYFILQFLEVILHWQSWRFVWLVQI